MAALTVPKTQATSTSRRLRALSLALALVVASVPALLLAEPASATDPTQVSFTLEGCRNDGSITLPDAGGDFICPDGAYTPGNLGKGWNELDLVPYRLFADAGNAAPANQTYTIAVAVDHEKSGVNGYDFLSTPALNTALSDPGCAVPVVGGEVLMAPGLGGVDVTAYREVTVTQTGNTTCVYDYFARLAIGASAYPGSSLHANLGLPTSATTITTQGIGARDVSIPVREILPQDLDKDMAAVRDSEHIWTITKLPTPARLSFTNTCDTSPGARMATVDVAVSWSRSAADPTGFTVTTQVYATNPASRPITVTVTDVIRTGTTPLATVTGSPTSVPANTASALVLTHTLDVALSGVLDPRAPDFNDVATATYTDDATGIPIPQTTTAMAAVADTDIGAGTVLNETASIRDVEGITGTGLSFSVATPALGTFDGYVAGTPTTGPVTWDSGTLASDGSVTFAKTVYVDQPRIVTGSLSDTATLTGSDGFVTSADASIAIQAGAQVSLEISKTLDTAVSTPLTFDFDVLSGTDVVATARVSYAANETGTETTVVTGLAPGSYTVHELANGNFPEQFADVAIELPTCSAGVSFTNRLAPAGARVQKVTDPATLAGAWTFTLTGPGIPGGNEVQLANANAGYVNFVSDLGVDGGVYTVTETPQVGFDATGIVGDFTRGLATRAATTDLVTRTCSFTLDLLNDDGGLFSCTFTNTQRGDVTVLKTENSSTPTTSYSFQLTGGPDAVDLTRTTDATNLGALDFGLQRPGTYALCELAVPAGTTTTLETTYGAVVDPATGDACLAFALAAGETLIFTVDNSYPEGDQRTIGYWKNWNSCSSGPDRVLLSARTGNRLMDEFLPQTLGAFLVDSCEDGVHVLRSASGRYAENALAAQLLAAKLNAAAGASVCAPVLDAIVYGDDLLAQIGYDGPVSRLVRNKHPERQHFLDVAGLLDDYNNGLVC